VTDRIEQAYIYGSLARGNERPDSDVDLLIIGNVTLRELSPLLREAGRVLHRAINPTLHTSEEYEQELKAADSFISRVHRGERVDLIGGTR